MKDREPGFLLLVNMIVDQDTQEQVQLTCNAPIESTSSDLARLLATMREAGWAERIAANDRILARAETIKIERDRRIEEAKVAGEAVDEESIAEEDARINAALIKVRSEAAADRAASNGHMD